MVKRRGAHDQNTLERPETVVVVCRGGDCGSRRKHPEIDHVAQLREIRNGVGAAVTVVVSRCFDACEHSNVVVVLPGEHGREADETAVWIGDVNDLDATADLTRWVNEGGPGSADRPVLVDIHRFIPTRLSRRELETVPVPPRRR